MTPADHRERAFEVIIEEHLVGRGGSRRLDPAAFDRGIALWPGAYHSGDSRTGATAPTGHLPLEPV